MARKPDLRLWLEGDTAHILIKGGEYTQVELEGSAAEELALLIDKPNPEIYEGWRRVLEALLAVAP